MEKSRYICDDFIEMISYAKKGFFPDSVSELTSHICSSNFMIVTSVFFYLVCNISKQFYISKQFLSLQSLMLVITEMQAHLQFFCVIGNERNRALALNGSYGSISFFFTSSYPIFRASAFSSLPCFLGHALGWVSSAWGTLLPVRGRGAIP